VWWRRCLCRSSLGCRKSSRRMAAACRHSPHSRNQDCLLRAKADGPGILSNCRDPCWPYRSRLLQHCADRAGISPRLLKARKSQMRDITELAGAKVPLLVRPVAAPSGARDHDWMIGNIAVLRFPFPNIVGTQRRIRVTGGPSGKIDHCGRPHRRA
jgi:hypothetical protein